MISIPPFEKRGKATYSQFPCPPYPLHARTRIPQDQDGEEEFRRVRKGEVGGDETEELVVAGEVGDQRDVEVLLGGSDGCQDRVEGDSNDQGCVRNKG